MQFAGESTVIGCDIGGSSGKVGMIGHTGIVEKRAAFPITDPANLDAFLRQLYTVMDQMVGERTVCGIGMLLPGYLKQNRTVPRIMVNLPMLENVPLARLLRDRYGVEVGLDIDRNGPAHAEYMLHYQTCAPRLLYVTIGTGLGVGLVVDGAVCRVANDSIGEMGHISLDPAGVPCVCGNIGCAETLISRDGIGRIARQLGLCGSLFASRNVRELPQVLYTAAVSGDRGALRVFEEFGRHLGIALTTYANILSPDVIVVGGGLSGAAEFFLSVAEDWLNAHWIERATKGIRVERTKFGADAGIIGAASLVLPLARRTGVIT